MALRVRVCPLAAIVDDELRAFAVTGVTWPVLVTRLAGELVAVPSVCPHEDVSLAGGEFAGGVVVCPGHGYAFDVRTGRCGHDAGLLLRRYPVTVVDGDVWVDLL
ncbi:MAG TPA: Rieske 2Fe-2S domain-containing protein [Kofleriaceae bacterium]